MSDASHPDFHELVQEYYQPLYKFAYSLAKNPDGASDLTQQTFLIWAQKGEALRDKGKVKSWLFTTLYRQFLRVRRKGDQSVSTEPENLEYALPAVEPNVVTSLDAQAAVEALQEVDEVFRAPLTLFYLEDMAYKEIAETLDVPIGTIMSRLSRGKAQLKQILLKKRK